MITMVFLRGHLSLHRTMSLPYPFLPGALAYLAFSSLVLDPGIQIMVGALRVLVQVVDQPRGVDDHMLPCMVCTVVCGRCCSCLLLQQGWHCVPLNLVLYSLRNCMRTFTAQTLKKTSLHTHTHSQLSSIIHETN